MKDLELDKGLTLADVVRFISEFIQELKKRRLMIIVIMLASCITGFVLHFFSDKPQYIATTTLMLENNKNGGGGGALALASQLGLVGSGGSGMALSEDKLLDIIKSEAIMRIALFDKAKIDSTEDYFVNHFIKLFGYEELWQKDDSLRNFKFEHTKDKLSVKENGVFKAFYGQVVSDFLKVEQSPKSGIVKITIQSTSPQFSKLFNQSLVSALITFYVDRITAKERKNVTVIQNRVDSIAGALRDAEYAYARWKDGSNQLVKAQGMINEIRLRRDVEVANSIYIEGIKQLEISKFALLDETPILQIVDEPSFPLAKTRKTSRNRYILIGFVFGLILSGIYVFLIKKYIELRDQLTKNDFSSPK